jgi:cell division protein FtsZ
MPTPAPAPAPVAEYEEEEVEEVYEEELPPAPAPAPQPAPIPAPAARQPHVQAPQYAPVQTQRPTPIVNANRVPVKTEEEELEIPAFIRKKMM